MEIKGSTDDTSYIHAFWHHLGFVMKDLHCLTVELHFFGLDGLPCLGKKGRNEVCLIVVPVSGFLAKLN